jgi:hypothetical protein
MAQPDLQDAIREWVGYNADEALTNREVGARLERLLEDVAARRDGEWADNCGAPPRIHIHETILAALKDENDG